MKTRIVWTKIWEDEWFQSLSDQAQKLFIYLITNSRVNMCGCYQVSDRVMAFDTRIKDLEKVKKELTPKVRFTDGWVYVVNAQGYSGFRGSKNDKALEKEISEIPTNIKNTLCYEKEYRVLDNSNTLSENTDTSINHKSEIINKKLEIKNNKGKHKYDDSDLNEEVLSYVAKLYNISMDTVRDKKRDIEGYCKSTGTMYVDYRATLENWVRRDLKSGKIRKASNYELSVPILPTMTLEQRTKSLEQLDKIREGVKQKLSIKSI